MRIVEHSVRRWESYPEADTETCLWEACVEHEGEYYEVQVEAREVGGDKMYYMGYIRNTQCIKAHFSDGWLGFGFFRYTWHVQVYPEVNAESDPGGLQLHRGERAIR
mgnify:CR=1 FL=1